MSALKITQRFVIPDNELRWTATRSSGPGGQNINKVNSKVTLRWQCTPQPGFDADWHGRFLKRFATRINREGEVVLHSEKTRDQAKNLADVRSRLVHMLLACRVPPKARKATKPTLGSQRRRIEGKKRNSQKKRMRGRVRPDD